MSKKLIYILGTGRTGTTLIGIVLSNNPEIFDTGEILKFIELKGEPHGFSQDTKNYQFWKRMYHDLEKDLHLDEGLNTIIRRIEYHKFFLLNFISKKKSKSKQRAYSKYINAFFSRIFCQTKNIVIDSSKYPGRALAIERHLKSDIEKYYIYLKRNPISVINAFAKKGLEQPSKGYLATNIYYFLINLFCNMVLLRIHRKRKITIKYEDFIAEPTETLITIQNKFHINLNNSIELIKNNEELKTGYIFEGNRIRLQERIRIVQVNKKIKPGKLKDYLTLVFNGFWY